MLNEFKVKNMFGMKKSLVQLIGCLSFLTLSGSCTEHCEDVIDTSGIDMEVDLVRLETQYKGVKSPEDAQDFLARNEKFTNYNLDAGKPEELLLQEVQRLGIVPIDTLLLDVSKQYGDFQREKEELTGLFKNIKTFYPDFTAPEINTMVSGFGGYILDDGGDVLLIGLDYFLDSTATYLPPKNEIPNYIKRHLTKEKIVVKTAFALSNRFFEMETGAELINHMIKYGKQYYFAHRMLPCKEEFEILDYTPEEWEIIKKHEYSTYAYFTKNELFYNTKQEKYRLFLGESPKCTAVGDDCPGRIGRWLGYEIIKSYVENNDVSLQELMAEQNLIKIFTQSGYKPGK